MKRRKRGRKTIRKPEEPKEVRSKLEIDTRRGPYSDDQEGPRGLGRAVVTLNECLRREPPREPLREIDRLVRVKPPAREA